MQAITTHLNADFDCLASMLAAKKLYPDARLVFPGSQEKNVRDFFKFSDMAFQFDRLRHFPMEEVDLLIIVDTKRRERIGAFKDLLDKPGMRVHVYDHHPSMESDLPAEKMLVLERGASATVMLEILREKEMQITPDEATILAMGIYEDTAYLTSSSTTEEDFRAMEYLLSRGANLSTVSDFVNRELTPDQVWLLNELLHAIETHKINGVDVSIATASSEKYISELALLTHKVKDIENLNLLFSLVRMGDRLCLVARSRIEAVDVAEVASEFGGGGHPTASSASIRDLTLPQAKERLIEVLHQKIHADDTAGEMMSAPAKSISADATIAEARKSMILFERNVLPVVRHEKPVGLLTRQVVGKAVYHLMEREKVCAWMTTEIAIVTEETPYQDLSQIILEEKQALVPVVDSARGHLLGVVTRTDLLQKLYGESLKKPRILKRGEGARFPYSKSVKGLLRERLPKRILELFYSAGEVSEEMGFNVYAVGGLVRDLLLRIKNYDVDLVVEGDGIALAHKLAEGLEGRVNIHQRFRTAVIILPDGFKIDVATARIESYEHPAALPLVEQGSIRNDLQRRDFTINTLAIKLNGKNAFRLIDFFGGQKDLKEKAIRILHNLSFVEDPTRAFRAVRFEQRFHFVIGRHSLTMLKNAVRKDLLGRLSGARVLNELVLMFREKEPEKMIQRMCSLGLLRFIHPAIEIHDRDLSFFRRISEAVVWYDLLYTERPVRVWIVFLMGLLRNLELREQVETCKNLGISPSDEALMIHGREIAAKASRLLNAGEKTSQVDIYKALQPLPPELLLFLMAFLQKEEARKNLSHYLTQLMNTGTELSGRDLIRMGLRPGPLFKIIMDDLLYARLKGAVKSREDEIRLVKERFLTVEKAGTREA